MKGDFSRITFDAKNHFSRVLTQQGRVTLDADPNEEGAILLHYLRTLARDIIGACGGPPDNMGFELTLDTTQAGHPTLMIGKGRYYVDGVLVENDGDCDYASQPDWTPGPDDPLLKRLAASGGDDVWLYLDVWERHVTWIEDDAIREPALGGPDTCTRAKVVWQVRGIARKAVVDALSGRRDDVARRIKEDKTLTDGERAALQAEQDRLQQDVDQLTQADGNARDDCTAPLDALSGLSDAQMTARLDPGQKIKDPCAVSPDALYRGAENQLYRVEVHRGSAAGVKPTFKWSRDNGSVATRWLGTEGNDILVTSGRGFSARTWVELSDDANDRLGEPGVLVELTKVDGNRLSVDPASIPPGRSIAFTPALGHAKVRRWDQKETDDTTLDEGAVPLVESTTTDDTWLPLEDGIQVRFGAGGIYRCGDYWLIPARVATGGIDWPFTKDANDEPVWQPQPPRGIEHHYAPLGYVGANSDGNLATTPCLCEIEPINSCSRAFNPDRAAVVPARKPVRARPKGPTTRPR
jgi:hypothetical protein